MRHSLFRFNLTELDTMGMFDNVTCEYPLPAEPKPCDNSFQTKDFDRRLDHYTITEDGRLLKQGTEVRYHGVFNFYTYTADDMWFEYEVKFTDGRLNEIRAISIRKDGDGRTGYVLCPPPDQSRDA